MTAYYNEIDPYAAQWLRNLISKNLIAPGDVDERSIVDVQPDDLDGYTQCHFFAGIGGWSYALRLAGWPDDREIWTGSCPCQPFSIAGKHAGTNDERHLWPSFHSLIAASRPPVVMGEQVATAVGKGWLDEVHQDMDRLGYRFGAAVLPAESVGAPHARERIYFVSDARGTDATGRDEDRRRLTVTSEVGRNGTYASWQGGPSRHFSLADGVPSRVAKSCAGGFGNAIVPQLGAEVIRSYMDVTGSAS